MKFGQALTPSPFQTLAEFKQLFFKDGFPNVVYTQLRGRPYITNIY